MSEPAPVRTRRTPFTRRAAVFASVLFLVAVSVAYPAQRYVAQRQQISELRAEVAAGAEHVRDLERAVVAAGSPEYIEREARARLHLVMPGERAYLVVDPPPGAPAAGGAGLAPPAAAWWERLTHSVGTAATPVEQLPVGSGP